MLTFLPTSGVNIELRDVIETVRCPRYFLNRLEFFKTGVPVVAEQEQCSREQEYELPRRGLALQSRIN